MISKTSKKTPEIEVLLFLFKTAFIISVLFYALRAANVYANSDLTLLEKSSVKKAGIPTFAITKLEYCNYKGDKVIDQTATFLEESQIDFYQFKGYLKIYFDLFHTDKNENIKYVYQINNIQDNWVVLKNKYISIYQLPYGVHHVLIKAVNEEGEALGDMLNIPIHVIKPFYLKGKFLVSFLIILASIFFFIIHRNKQIKQELIAQQEKIRDSIYLKRANTNTIGGTSSNYRFVNVLNRLKLVYSEFSYSEMPVVTFLNTIPEETLLYADPNNLISILNTMIYRCFEYKKTPIKLVCKKMGDQIYILIEEDKDYDYDLATNAPSKTKKLNTFFRLFSSSNSTLHALEESIKDLGGVMIKRNGMMLTNSFLISLPLKIEIGSPAEHLQSVKTPFLKEQQKSESTNIENHFTLTTNADTDLLDFPEKGGPTVPTQTISWKDKEWLKELNLLVINNLDNNQFNTEYLADLLQISRRQLHRKLKKISGISPKDYIKEKRLTQAKYYLEQRKFYKIKDVAHSVGFKEPSYFTQLFTKRFGVKPSTYFRV